jgi:hypothetical protein
VPGAQLAVVAAVVDSSAVTQNRLSLQFVKHLLHMSGAKRMQLSSPNA